MFLFEQNNDFISLTAPREHMYDIDIWNLVLHIFILDMYVHADGKLSDVLTTWYTWKCPSPKFDEQFSIFAINIFCSWLFAHNYCAINKLQVLSTCLHTAGYSFSYSEQKPGFREPLHEQFN